MAKKEHISDTPAARPLRRRKAAPPHHRRGGCGRRCDLRPISGERP